MSRRIAWVLVAGMLGVVPLHAQENNGAHPVGFREVVLVDSGRAFVAVDGAAPHQGRPIHLYLWYPASTIDGAPMRFADLIGDPGAGEARGSTEALRRAAGPLRLAARPDSGRSLLDSTIAVVEGAPMAASHGAILLLGGLNGPPWLHAPLAIGLARRGYTVATLGSYGDGVGQPLPFDSTGFRTQFADATIALEWLRASPHANDRVVVGAWSVGGVAAAALAAGDSRIRGVLSLDSGLGYDYGPPALAALLRVTGHHARRDVPIVHLRGDQAGQFVVARSSAFLEAQDEGTMLEVTLPGLAHQHFISALLLSDPELGHHAMAALVELAAAFVGAAVAPTTPEPGNVIARVKAVAGGRSTTPRTP